MLKTEDGKNVKLWSLKEASQTKGMWYMMENDLIIKVKYGEKGKKILQTMITNRKKAR